MRVIRQYLFKSITSMIGLVLAVLLSLAIFIEFVGELADIGTGDYGMPEVLFFALLKVPKTTFEMLPMATLLGSLLGLGALASSSEIIVLRAAGVSTGRLARAVAVTGVGLALFTMLLGEFIAPPLDNYARQFRTLMKHGQSSMPLGGGAWLRDGDTIISLGAQDEDFRYGVVYMFRMDGARLTSVARADSAEVDETDQWVLNNYAKTSFGSDGVTVQESSRAIQPYSLNAEVLALMVVRPSSLTGAAMYKYIRYLKANELDARRYEVALWSRVASAVAVLPMCLLALPFAFRDLRSSSTGARLVVGVIIGLAYFLASRTLGDGAAVYQLNPVFVAWLPTVLLGLAVVLLLRRVR